MIRLIDLLKEAKQVGTIYHYTSLGALQSILETNKLISQRNYISFTRNKNWWPWKTSIKLSFDGDKLSNKYKIQPFSDIDNIIKGSDEYEERVMLREINNLSKYILVIEINTSKFTAEEKKIWLDGYYEYIMQTMDPSFHTIKLSITPNP